MFPRGGILNSGRASTFSGQVLVLFSTQIFGAGIGIINGILLARLLGPAAKGDYTFIVLLPASAIVLVQLGLPQAFGYFAARAQTIGIFGKSVALAAALSLVAHRGSPRRVGVRRATRYRKESLRSSSRWRSRPCPLR